MSELLLPGAIRSKALSIALFLNSMSSALLVSVFLPINNFLGNSACFILCGTLTLVYSFIIFIICAKNY
ncbi:MAG: hypothetical protein AB8V10_05055 [Francisella endosymbiont of Hyalomma asiaticum]